MPLFIWCKAPGIYHLPAKQLLENTPYLVEVIADADYPPPQSVRVYYRIGNNTHFNELRAQAQGHLFRAIIPVEAVSGDSVRYFIVGNFGSRGLVGLPADNPQKTPFTVPVLKLADLINQSKALEIQQNQQTQGKIRFVQAPKAQVDLTVTPWRVISTKHQPAKIPQYHATLPDSAVECGMLRAEGNAFTGYVELYKAIVKMAQGQRADGFTELKYVAYTQRSAAGDMTSMPVMEAVYYSYGRTHQY